MFKLVLVILIILSNIYLFSTTDKDRQLADRAFEVAKKHIENKDYINAKKFLSYALSKNPEHTFAFARLVVVLTHLEDYETLVKYYEPYANKNLNDESVLFNMGTFLMKVKEWAKAVDYFDKVLKFNPQNVKAIYNLSLCYIELKKFKKSIEYSIQSIKLNHNMVDSLRNIVKSHIELKLWDAGLEYAKELIKQTNETDPFAFDSASILYAGKNDYQSAIQYIKKAISLKDLSLFQIRLKKYEEELKKQK